MRASSQKNSIWRGLSGLLVAMGMWGLILPPPIAADVLAGAPDSFGVTLPFENLTLGFAQQADGSYAWGDSQGRTGVVDAASINGIEILGSSQGSEGQFSAHLTVPDGAGGSAAYTVNGVLLPGGGAQTTVTDAAGAAHTLLLDWSDDGDDPIAPWLIGAIVVGAGLLACAGVAIATDCIGDCAAACGSAGMSSATEGLCGTCTCTCN